MRNSISTVCSLIFFAVTGALLSGCHPYFDEILREVEREAKDLPEEVVITQPALFPEGVEYDTEGKRYLVSSLTEGTIGAVDDEGTYEPFIEDSDFVSTIGIEVDEDRQRLLVCVSDPNTGTVAALGSYDLRSGERLFFTDLAAIADDGASHFANDVAVDEHGNAYVTDSFSPIIYKVDIHGNASVFLQDHTFQAAAGAFGLNGVVYHPDGYLIVGFSETATLYKVPLDHPGNFSAIDTEEGVVTSPDGLYLSNNSKTLVVVNNDNGGENGNVVSLSGEHHWKSAQADGTFATGAVFPTTVTQRGHNYYVLYAHLNELFAGNTSREEFKIVRVDFEEVL